MASDSDGEWRSERSGERGGSEQIRGRVRAREAPSVKTVNAAPDTIRKRLRAHELFNYRTTQLKTQETAGMRTDGGLSSRCVYSTGHRFHTVEAENREGEGESNIR